MTSGIRTIKRNKWLAELEREIPQGNKRSASNLGRKIAALDLSLAAVAAAAYLS